MNEGVTPKEEHRNRHCQLHWCLYELIADYLLKTGCAKLPSEATLAELLSWSYQQTIEPDEMPVPVRQISRV